VTIAGAACPIVAVDDGGVGAAMRGGTGTMPGSSGEDPSAADSSGADGFLAKPFNGRQLLAALEGLLPQR
jgi:hypothetical protein